MRAPRLPRPEDKLATTRNAPGATEAERSLAKGRVSRAAASAARAHRASRAARDTLSKESPDRRSRTPRLQNALAKEQATPIRRLHAAPHPARNLPSRPGPAATRPALEKPRHTHASRLSRRQ